MELQMVYPKNCPRNVAVGRKERKFGETQQGIVGQQRLSGTDGPYTHSLPRSSSNINAHTDVDNLIQIGLKRFFIVPHYTRLVPGASGGKE